MLSLCSFTFVLGAQKKRLINTVLLYTKNICFGCDYGILHISSGFMNIFFYICLRCSKEAYICQYEYSEYQKQIF